MTKCPEDVYVVVCGGYTQCIRSYRTTLCDEEKFAPPVIKRGK